MKYTGPDCRRCRRESQKLFLKGSRCYSPKCPIEKKNALPPGQHGQKGRYRISDYGKQLREKQKVKRLYGINERQMKNYFTAALQEKGKTGEALLSLLESRLDNVIFRLGLASSRASSRQLISHGHVFIDNRRVDKPSYQARPKQLISLSSKALTIPDVKKTLGEKSQPPAWLKRKAAVGTIDHLPKRDEIDTAIEEGLLVEFYSR